MRRADPVADAIVLKNVQALADGRVRDALVLAIGEPRRVPVRQDSEHARRPLSLHRSMEAMRPLAIVLLTTAACARFGTLNSAV